MPWSLHGHLSGQFHILVSLCLEAAYSYLCVAAVFHCFQSWRNWLAATHVTPIQQTLFDTLWQCLFLTLLIFFETVANTSGRTGTGTNTASAQSYVPSETSVLHTSFAGKCIDARNLRDGAFS